MVGNGSMVLTHSQQTEAMERLETLTEMECRIYRNTPTCNPQTGTIQPQPVFSTMVFGGMERFQSTIGTKRIPCNSTNQSVATLVAMDRGTRFCAMKTPLETSVQTVSMMTRTVRSMVPIPIMMVMRIVLPMMMTVTESLTKTRTAGILTAMECRMDGKLQTD